MERVPPVEIEARFEGTSNLISVKQQGWITYSPKEKSRKREETSDVLWHINHDNSPTIKQTENKVDLQV